MRRLALGSLLSLACASTVLAKDHSFRFGLGSATVKGLFDKDDKGSYSGLLLGYRHAADNAFYFDAQLDVLSGKTKTKDGSDLTSSLSTMDLAAGYRFAIQGTQFAVTPLLGRRSFVLATINDDKLTTQDITLTTGAWKVGGNLAYQITAPLTLGFETYYVMPDLNEKTVKTKAFGISTTQNFELKNEPWVSWGIPVKYVLNERWELEGRYEAHERKLIPKEKSSEKTTLTYSEMSLTAGVRF